MIRCRPREVASTRSPAPPCPAILTSRRVLALIGAALIGPLAAVEELHVIEDSIYRETTEQQFQFRDPDPVIE